MVAGDDAETIAVRHSRQGDYFYQLRKFPRSMPRRVAFPRTGCTPVLWWVRWSVHQPFDSRRITWGGNPSETTGCRQMGQQRKKRM